MKSCAAAALAAAITSSRVASGLPKAMLSRIVPANRVVSCRTMPICERSEFEGHIAQIVPVDGDAPFGGIVEARQQVDDGGLARAGGAQQGDRLARLGLEADILQHRLAAAEVAEGDILEAHPALHRRQRDGTRLVGHIALGVQDLKDARRPKRMPAPSG